MKKIIFILTVFSGIVAGLCAQTPELFYQQDEPRFFGQWANQDTISAAQELSQYRSAMNESYAPDTIQIFGSDGYIYIRSPRRYPAQVYTMLGQVVRQTYVNPGYTEMLVGGRGIYLVRVGDVTRKVVL